MDDFFKHMDDTTNRILIFILMGAVYFVIIYSFDSLRDSGLFISFVISVMVGLLSQTASIALANSGLYIVGTIVGLLLLTLKTVLFAQNLNPNSPALIFAMGKISLFTILISMLPWLLGAPLGLWLRRRTKST